MLREQILSFKTISQGQLKVYETTVFLDKRKTCASARKVGKGEWRMPRLLQATKDVISCEKPR